MADEVNPKEPATQDSEAAMDELLDFDAIERDQEAQAVQGGQEKEDGEAT